MPLALFSLAASQDARAEVDVRVEAGRVSIRAEAAPLSEVLDRLSRQLGMKVIYEGMPPRAMVSATLENRTPAQAVIGVLEGTGVDYLARMDRTATRVDTLIVSTTSGGGPGPAAPHPAVPALGRPVPPVDEEESDDDDEPEEPPPPPKLRPGRGQPLDDTDQGRPRPGGGPFMGRQPNAPGSPGAGPGGGLAPGNGAQRSYPVSPFAPVPPPPTTLPAPTVPMQPQPGDDDEVE